MAALGFKPSSLAAFGFAPGTISTIVKVDTTDAQLSADQVLFNLPDFYLYAAAKKAANVVTENTLNTRGARGPGSGHAVSGGAGGRRRRSPTRRRC